MKTLILSLAILSCNTREVNPPLDAGQADVKLDVEETFTIIKALELEEKLELEIKRREIFYRNAPHPESPTTRGLLYLQPYPGAKININDIDLIKYKCSFHAEGMVCTGCYDIMDGLDTGNLSVLCPSRPRDPCMILRHDQWNLEDHYGVPVQECPGSLW